MSKQMLQGERIAAAIHKVLSRKGMPEHVEAGFVYHTKRELRREIERERRGGVLILANQHGYFLPSENEEEARHELSEFVRSAEKKSKSLLLTIKHAKAALKQCLGQTELFEVGNDATA